MAPDRYKRALLAGLVLGVMVVSAAAADTGLVRKMASFERTGQLYERCTSTSSAQQTFCEAFITGIAAAMQDQQISRVRVCIPMGTTSRDVTNKVVAYLATKADADDMKVSATSIIVPLLAILYNCTPNQMPKFEQQ